VAVWESWPFANVTESGVSVRDLRDQRIILTGCSGGIGRRVAEALAAEHARLVLASRSTDRIQALADELVAKGTNVIAVPADITRAEDRERVLNRAVEHFGGIDVLINNAGVASFGHFESSSEAILRQIMEVNFFAPAELIRLAIPQLARGRCPAIVNVSSMCGRRGLPAWPEYSASKFALCGLTEALRGEMARFDISVLLIVPGLTRSDLGAHLLRNEGRMKIDFTQGMSPEIVAARIVRAIRRNKVESILGWDAKWMLRINRFFPRLLDRLLARRVRHLYWDQRKQDRIRRAAEVSKKGTLSDRMNSSVAI
jgi:short-subunit dehydrogenase